MLALVPHEISLGWIYLPPVLLVAGLGFLLATVATRVLNRTGASRYFWHPQLALLAMSVLLGALVGLFLISP